MKKHRVVFKTRPYLRAYFQHVTAAKRVQSKALNNPRVSYAEIAACGDYYMLVVWYA